MSSTQSSNSSLSKADIQMLVTSNDPSISIVKPTAVRSKCWTNYSQVHHQNVALDYIVCLECKTVLKWTSENGTRVMNHHKCMKSKSLSSTSTRQRTISSYCQQPFLCWTIIPQRRWNGIQQSGKTVDMCWCYPGYVCWCR